MSEEARNAILDLLRKSVGLTPASATGCCGAPEASCEEKEGGCCESTGAPATTPSDCDCEEVR